MLTAMSRWSELVPGMRGQILRTLMCDAAAIAHTENGARFAPDDLGDDALIYGLCTTNSARYVAGRRVEEAQLEGVWVCERGRVWWLEIQREAGPILRVYFYKAPPGARSVHGLRLDDTEIKKELSTVNGQQLELFNRSGARGSAELLNLVVVHFGDPSSGLEKLDVGAPYLAHGEVAWDWFESFDDADADTGTDDVPAPLSDDGRGYPGLRLVSAGELADGENAAATAGVDPPTSEFQTLRLRRDQGEDPGAASGSEQDSS
jgi:hypothetical protein